MKLVTFGEAIEALKNGKTIYRQLWCGTKLILAQATPMMDAVIVAKLWNGHNVTWVPTHDDILNDDWIVE